MKIKTCDLSRFCSGCGACGDTYGVGVKTDENGFIRPENNEEVFSGKAANICPAVHCYDKAGISSSVWGVIEAAYTGYSSDEMIREKASSGGIITQMACYLLAEKMIDGVLHIGLKGKDIVDTKLYCSTTFEEIISKCGSRYSPSAPLLELSEIIEKGKKYAFIGKPCDCRALRLLMNSNTELRDQIKYVFSFFCAGMPSKTASKMLIKQMGGNYEDIVSLGYRGNGWPGYATAVDRDGMILKMDYEKSWGTILGRNVQTACRFCWDGIGEEADIACGDAWFLENNKPSFKENKGRNAILARNLHGLELIKKMQKNGCIEIEDFDVNLLKYMQPYQYSRRITMIDKLRALKMMFIRVPEYDTKAMKQYTKTSSKKQRIRVFGGVVKRVLKKKI